MAKYTYLPWVRQGLISAATSNDIVDGRIQLTVNAEISDGAGGTTKTQPVKIMLFGPEHVTGIDKMATVRGSTIPADQTPDFEPYYFPMIEFDPPDFPWLFTPEVTVNNRLTPWICLIAVEKRDGVK